MLSHACYQMLSSLSSVQSFDHFLYQNSHPLKRVSLWVSPRDPWYSLLPASSSMSNGVSSAGVICPSHIPIRCSLVQASHPIIHITSTSWGLAGSSWPLGMPWPAGLHHPLHDSICNSSMTFMHCICSCFHLHCLSSPISWTCQAESHIPCICIGEPLLFMIIFQRTKLLPLVQGP